MKTKRISNTSILGPILLAGVVVIASFGLATNPALSRTLLSLILGINGNRINSESAKEIQYLQPNMVRLDGFPWDIVEAKKGVYDYAAPDTTMQWARANKLSVLGIIQYAPGWANGQDFTTPKNIGISNCGIPDLADTNTSFNQLRTYPPKSPADFGSYASHIAKRYPDVTYWQIWNEPNNPIFWPTGPDAAAYTRLLTAAYSNIKKANPQAQVVLGGISLNDLKYINALYSAGAKKYFDIMAVHLYNPSQAPNAYLSQELDKLHTAMVQNGDGDKQIWLTEIGWYTGTALHAVTDEQQGQYLDQVVGIARSKPYVGAVFWNTIMDCTTGYDANNPENNFGIFDTNLVPKPAANVMHGMMLRK